MSGVYIKTETDKFYVPDGEYRILGAFLSVFVEDVRKLDIPIETVRYVISNCNYNQYVSLPIDLKRGCIQI